MSIFQMSVSAAILILAVVVIRALAIHKLPKITFLVLWGVVLPRLLIPFSIPLPFIANRVVDKAAEWVTGLTNTQAVTADSSKLPSINTIAPFISATAQDGIMQTSHVLVLWVIGMSACALFFLITHFRCCREYKAAIPIKNGFINVWLQQHKISRPILIKQSDRINAPMTYGIWKPIILLPKTTDWQDEDGLRYVFTHELTHIKRFDILAKWLLAAVVCVHWFNPLVWVMYVLANRDIELACDEKVVWILGEKMKSVYALKLIELEECKSSFSALCNHFAKNAIEERINAIMKIKRTTLKAMLLALALVAGLTAGALALSAIPLLSGDVAGEEQTLSPVHDEEPESISYVDKIAAVPVGDDYYTRIQIQQLFDSGLTQHYIDIRQNHIQPELPPDKPGGEGLPNNNGGICDNTYYLLVEGQRVCSTCGYIFTEEQDRAIELR